MNFATVIREEIIILSMVILVVGTAEGAALERKEEVKGGNMTGFRVRM